VGDEGGDAVTRTAKLVEGRDRIKALAMKRRDAARRSREINHPEIVVSRRNAEAAGLDIAVRVLEDLLQD